MSNFNSLMSTLTFGATRSLGLKHPKGPVITPEPMPQAPDIGQAQATAQAEATRRKKASARSSTVKTSPLGVAGEAAIVQKTLLGL